MQTALAWYDPAADRASGFIGPIQHWLNYIIPRRPETKDGSHLFSCHAVARACKAHFHMTHWTVVDGYFNRGNRHSWLRYSNPEITLALDVYPAASAGGVLLVDTSSIGSPWCSLYHPEPSAYSDDERAKFKAEALEILAYADAHVKRRLDE